MYLESIISPTELGVHGIDYNTVYKIVYDQYRGAHIYNSGVISQIKNIEVIDIKACTQTGKLTARVKVDADFYMLYPDDVVTVKITHIQQSAIIAVIEHNLRVVVIADNLRPYTWVNGAFCAGEDTLVIGQEIEVKILMPRFKGNTYSFSCCLAPQTINN